MPTQEEPVMTTRRPRLGEESWFVEWVHELAWVDGDDSSEYREVDRDLCKTRIRRVATREEAERMAREVWPETHKAYGVVAFWPARYEAYDDQDGEGPYCHRWEPTADEEYYEGPEEAD